ncbi:hypothetical protein AB6A40_006417 [Gnathostoma spinigerum]|uniref:Uncharacterized protein n=1 Tax=Gnathostoma spinigerum TaxID=75299 RepID=A0ABD6ERS9_9BILA
MTVDGIMVEHVMCQGAQCEWFIHKMLTVRYAKVQTTFECRLKWECNGVMIIHAESFVCKEEMSTNGAVDKRPTTLNRIHIMFVGNEQSKNWRSMINERGDQRPNSKVDVRLLIQP